MIEYEFPCPYCCKHVKLSKEEFSSGGVVKCPHCKQSFRLSGHKEKTDKSESKTKK